VAGGQYCTRCGQALSGGAQFCGRCGAAVRSPVQPPVQSGGASPPFAPVMVGPGRPTPLVGHAVRTIVVIVAVVAAVIIALAVVPIPHSFSATLNSSGLSDGIQTFTFPIGAQVSGSWSTTDGGSVTLSIFAPDSLADVYDSDASSGSFSFTATNDSYEFDAFSLFSETTNVGGSYSSPLI
jgi:zinc ribbon protein